MSKSNQKPHRDRGASHLFKISMVVLLFAITLMHLAFISYFPGTEIIPEKIILGVTLFIVAYLWAREVRDHHRLLILNEELKASHEQLKQAEIDTIAALIKAEEEKDEYTCGHSERVTGVALAIADEVGFDENRKKIIARAGILHDIGKIGISDTILHKKEKLTDEEWAVIKRHPGKADEILEPLKFLAAEREIMLSHHERCDGKGYPRGLSGGQIGEDASILAVADAFDAMNSARSYRQPLSKEAILSELERSRGTQHSVWAVDSLLKALKKTPKLWER